MRCLINDILQLVIEFYFVVIRVWHWGVRLYYCVERDCSQADCDEPAGDWVTSHESVRDVLVNKKSNTMLIFIQFSTEKNTLCSSFGVVSRKFFLLISQSPGMFHPYLSISCVSSWSFPAALSVLVFHVPMVTLSLPRIFDDTLVACLTPPSWCTAEGAVLVGPGGDQSVMVWLLVFHHMMSHGQGITWRSPSLSKSNTWSLSSWWNPSNRLALVFELWRYPPSDAVLTSAMSPITGTLVEGGSVLFLPIQVQRTSPLPSTHTHTHTHTHQNKNTEGGGNDLEKKPRRISSFTNFFYERKQTYCTTVFYSIQRWRDIGCQTSKEDSTGKLYETRFEIWF